MSYKAIEMAHELASKLTVRLPSRTVAESFDSDGNPMILVGTGLAAGNTFIVRIKPIDASLAKDILGLASPVYTPHIAQFMTEASAASDLGYITWPTLAPAIAEVIELGARLEVYAVTNTVAMNTVLAAPATYFVSTYLKSSVEHDIFKGCLASS